MLVTAGEQEIIYPLIGAVTPVMRIFAFQGANMFAEGKTNKPPMTFVVAYRIDDETTQMLMQRCIDSGYKAEQIARYALKRYLAELSHKEVSP